MTSGVEQAPATQQPAALELLRAYHSSLQALQPLLLEYIESDASDEGIESIYKVCGQTWDMLTAIHRAAEQRLTIPEAPAEQAVLQLVQPATLPPEPKPIAKVIQEPVAAKSQPAKTETTLISYAASLNIPANFNEQLDALMELYDGRVNIAAVIKRILGTEQLSGHAFQELSTVLINDFGLEHTSRGFFVRKGTEWTPPKVSEAKKPVTQSPSTASLDKQIRDAVGSPAPTWKPKQRGRYR